MGSCGAFCSFCGKCGRRVTQEFTDNRPIDVMPPGVPAQAKDVEQADIDQSKSRVVENIVSSLKEGI